MRASRFAALGLISFLVLQGEGRATDWIVGPPGSGAPFTSIQAAIDEAHAGDRVLVLPGVYGGTVVIAKAIELIGAGSSVTTLQSFATMLPGIVPPPMRIKDLPASARVRVSGFTLGFLGTVAAPVTHILLVDSCLGRVELSDVRLFGASLPPLDAATAGGMLRVTDCAQVVASGVQAVGFNQVLPFPLPGAAAPIHGLAGILVEGSSLFLTDSTALGNSTRPPQSGFGGDGGVGMRVVASSVQIARSVIRGAQSAGLENGVAGAGGHGIDATQSFVLIHGGAQNSVNGAAGWELSFAGTVELGTPGSAVRVDEGSTLVYGADVMLVVGAATPMFPASPAVEAAAGAEVDARPERLPTVSIAPFAPHLGSVLTVTLSGQPGFDHIRAVAFQTAPAFGFPDVLGAALLDLSAIVLWHVETLGPGGTSSIQVPVPADPSLAGLEIVEQCAQALPNGVVISPPIIVTLVP